MMVIAALGFAAVITAWAGQAAAAAPLVLRCDGAPAIDLIDGAALCDLMRDLQIGLRVRMVEEIEVGQAAIDAF